MADIFISYARENRDAIRPMAEFLERKGWSVWWDPEMNPGLHFANVIQQEINAANCIIVAWTKESVQSEWVWNEAQEGKNRNALLPVLFEMVEPPLGFRHIHTAKLIDWNGEDDHEEVQKLVRVVEGFCGHPSDRKPEALNKPNIDTLSLKSKHKYAHRDKVSKLALPDKPSVAVLPFDNMSNDPEQEYFSDGITEDLITDLSKISGLFVISRHSTFTYKGKSIKVKDISEDLGVRYVLEGSVRKAGDRLRITAQLIDALTEDHLWVERFDRKLDDIFKMQDEVSRKIVNALKVNLTGLEEERLGHQNTDNIEAYDLFLRGQEQFYLSTADGIKNAIELFSKTIELDPNFAEAYAWKSRLVIFLFIAELKDTMDDTVIPALALARKAVELDELLPVAHAALGWALMWNREIDDAIVEVNKAIDLDPNFADGYMWESMVLSSSGDGQNALESIEKGIRLNPRYSVTYIFSFGLAYLTLGKYNDALSYFDRGIERNPNFLPNHMFKTATLGILRRVEEAKSACSKIYDLNPNYHITSMVNFYNDENLAKLVGNSLKSLHRC